MLGCHKSKYTSKLRPNTESTTTFKLPSSSALRCVMCIMFHKTFYSRRAVQQLDGARQKVLTFNKVGHSKASWGSDLKLSKSSKYAGCIKPELTEEVMTFHFIKRYTEWAKTAHRYHCNTGYLSLILNSETLNQFS